MELSSLSENIVVVPYERGGETVELSVNIDAFTPEFFRHLGKQFNDKVKDLQAQGKKKKDDPALFEAEARTLELNREIYAEMLSSGVLKEWTITENGLPIPPTREVLLKLPPRLVTELWDLCLEAAKTVKKREDGVTEATSESMPSGSRVPLALAPTG